VADRQIALSTHYLAFNVAAADLGGHSRSDRGAIRSGALQPQHHEIPRFRPVKPDLGRPAIVGDDEIQEAVAVQVACGKASADLHIGERRSGRLGDVTKLSVAYGLVERIRLGKGHGVGVEFDVVLNMAICDYQVFVTIVVDVEKVHAEFETLTSGLSHTDRVRNLLEK